ncbi:MULTISPECIES: nucleotidyltransferase family protein [unclassified Coleofasciculus]|uniref:nucleotidyltransferase family protein n=1 Tax=unclassified Coleofasciculus TaxID=2692782 RepID=UPI00187ECC24|nr:MULTISPECIES: nucleotidyltransferase family protein [unclassified Coleofasciculus]MBE9125529.1 nucleotidyltransferase family protein [Coleofasciculus sp. LEGE 07081]MBE9148607.1 nucleotidyltransferase family protein [Coleofasciculus sp. LEGE 07092]
MNIYQSLNKIELTSEHQLLLQASLLQGQKALQAWQQWKEVVDIEDHDAESFHLFPLLYQNLSAHQVDDPHLVRLKGVYRRQWCENQLLFSKLGVILKSFQEAGLKTMLLKAVALASQYYSEKGLRYLSEFDILVPTTDALKAIRLLEQLDWQPKGKLPENLTSVSHILRFENPEGQVINLHWHIFWSCFQDDADNEFWQDSLLTQVRDVSTYVLNPTDHLLALCVQVYPWNPVLPIYWLTDAMTILNSSSAEIDWHRLIRMAHTYQLVLPLKILLTKLQECLDAPIPISTLETLETINISGFEQREYKVLTTKSLPMFGSLTPRYFQYLRAVKNVNSRFKLLEFTRYLQYVWGLDHLWQVPYHATFLGIKRIRALHI